MWRCMAARRRVATQWRCGWGAEAARRMAAGQCGGVAMATRRQNLEPCGALLGHLRKLVDKFPFLGEPLKA